MQRAVEFGGFPERVVNDLLDVGAPKQGGLTTASGSAYF